MLNSKFKRTLAVLLCGVLAIGAVPNNVAKAGETDYDSCSECDTYRVDNTDIYRWDRTDWDALRSIAQTDNGVRITHTASGITHAVMHPINQAVAVDGAHMKLTVHNPGSTRFYVILSNGADTSTSEGLSFMMYPAGGQFAIGRNAFSAIDHTGYKEYNGSNSDRIFLPNTVYSSTTTEYDIKTEMQGGNLVFTINGYSIEVKEATLKEAKNLTDLTKVYFKIAPAGSSSYQPVDYTINYLHGGEEVCYDEIAEVESFITTMTTNQTNENAVAARKAYLALSEEAKACVDNSAYLDLENEAGVRLGDANFHLLTKSDIYRWDRTDWDALRSIAQTDNGVRITHTASGITHAVMHPINQAVAVDGAHMKLTVHNPGSTRFYVILSNGADTSTSEGLSFMMYPAGGQFAIGRNAFSAIDHTGYKEYNGSNSDRIFLPNTVYSSTTTEYDIKTEMQGGNLVFTINGYSIEVKEATLKEAKNLTDLTKVYFKIAPAGSSSYQPVDYTINYLHGGEDVCWSELSDVEQKIDFCHPTKPIKGNLDAAKNAYNALNVAGKEVVLNLDNLTTAEANIKEADFYHYGLTKPGVTGSSSWGVTHGQVPSGYNIDFSQCANLGWIYNFRLDQSIQLNGAHIGVTLPANGHDNFLLSLSTANDNNIIDKALRLRLDMRNGRNELYVLGPSNVDTSGFIGYDGTNKDRIKFPSLGENELDIRFYVDNNKSLYITVNGYYLKFTKEQLSGLQYFNVDQSIFVGVSGERNSAKPNITVNYVVSGDTNSYDEITGDVNNDTTTNILDIIRMKRYEAATDKNTVLVSYYRSASDLDGNGTIGDTADLQGLRQELVRAQ